MTCDRARLLVDPDDVDHADPHVAACADCQAQLAALRRIARAMRDVGASSRRRPDHLERVWTALDRTSRPRRARSTIVATGAVLLAAAAVVALWLRRPAPPPRFEVSVISGSGAAIRGDAHLGDRVRIRARAEDAITVRVYRNDRHLLLDCPRMCRREGGSYVGEVPLDAVARYQVAWIRGTVPPATGSLDGDIAAATAAGAQHELRELEVR